MPKQQGSHSPVADWLAALQGTDGDKRARRDQAIDLFKARAEDYARNFFSLRDVEWTITYQLFAGLGLVGAAYAQLHEALKGSLIPVLT